MYSLIVILVGWVIFRADTLQQAIEYLKIMFIPKFQTNYLELASVINIRNIAIIIIAILFSGIIQSIFKKTKNAEKIKKNYQYIEFIIIAILLVICITMLVSNTYNPFIYFRF